MPPMTGDYQASAQAATETEAGRRAREALELDYGDAYMIGHSEDHGWNAARRDEIGGYLAKDTPDELRAAMAEDLTVRPVSELWCSACGKRLVKRAGGVVHARTGHAAGAPDGHPASPAVTEPPLWRAAREIAADYDGTFTLTARFGFLRADWASPGTGTPVHYEAPDEAGMRLRLDEALAVSRRERSREGARQ